jgi:RNA polymerase sigma factor (sigma-70 family)
MTTDRLRDALGHLRLALAPPEADGPLLARFLSARDEFAFAALVRRHGPMVLGVCRRVLRHDQDAEDAFQATFLVLARKAASVRKRDAVGSWLYGVAYRTARRLRDLRARRQAREKQVDVMPQPQARPEEVPDWWPLLDQELNRLPEAYRAPVVLCDLQGVSRREAARQLRLSNGSLSRRLAEGRRLLAGRLSGRGMALSGGALAAVLSQGAASAQVPAALVVATARAAGLVAAGHLAAVSAPVAVLTTGVLRAMFLAKAKVVFAAVVLVAALGAGGVAYRSDSVWAGQAEPPSKAKPRTELEALRRENELLKLNLEVVLEKVRTQEQELRGFREKTKAVPYDAAQYDAALTRYRAQLALGRAPRNEVDATKQAEAAVKALREANDNESRRRAVDALEQALRNLRQQLPGVRPPDAKRPPEAR